MPPAPPAPPSVRRPRSVRRRGGGYVELRARSTFSFLEGASCPEDLADRAAELEYPALALADRGGVYGIPRFHQAARAAGVRAIVGAEVDLEPGDASLLLLVESPEGWRRLCRLITDGHAGRDKTVCRVGWDRVEEHAGDWTVLVRGDERLTPALLDRARGVFGADPERLWVDVSRHLDRPAERAMRRAVDMAEACGVPLVATGDVRAASPRGRALLDALTCLRHKTTLDAAGRRLLRNGERHLQARADVERRFADRPAWIDATRTIAERAGFTLENLGYRFPAFPTPGGAPQAAHLRRLAWRGARARYGSPLPVRARRQIEHELAVIEKLDLAGYFLIVHDIADHARRERILCQGRGSAANSAVCYALGITAVDPVGMELLFERFLSEERGEWPDIDLDLPSGDPRERVIQYVFEKYGAHGAAMTANVITYRIRMAVREMGKVVGLSPDVVDRLAGKLSHLHWDDGPGALPARVAEAGLDPASPRIARLLELVGAVQGLPRHLGQHSGGIVIAAGRLDEVVPIEPASMPGRRVVQWDKEDCADLGIIKIDLLGLGMLAALEEAIPLIREHEGVAVDLAHLPPDDPATYAMIQRADTVGVFQIESRAQMATLPRMKPRTFYDLVVEIAIIRPGPIVGQMVHPYLNRRAGREPVTYPHPSLEPILRRTLGVPIFQEQLLRVAMTAAGFSGGEAEELRRAMGFKRSVERMERIEERLRAGMARGGITGDAQEEIVRHITSFALYGFPESHSASFALIAYASSYLKCHHPAAFLCALLNAWPMGFYSPATLVKDAQRHGVAVRPIDVTRSAWRCTLEPGGPPQLEHEDEQKRSGGPVRLEHANEQGRSGAAARLESADERRRSGGPSARPAVRIGLRFASGMREETAHWLEAEREERPFESLADLVRRVPLRADELDTLAGLGALAPLADAPDDRRAALWQVAAIERDGRSLFAGERPGEREPAALERLSPLENTLADYRLAGITTGPQVMAHLRPALDARGLLPAGAVRAARDGQVVRTAGHVIVRQRPGSAKGFLFLTLEDETGTCNAVLTPRQADRFRVPLHASQLLEIAGPVQNVDDVVHVKLRHLAPLDLRGAALDRSGAPLDRSGAPLPPGRSYR